MPPFNDSSPSSLDLSAFVELGKLVKSFEQNAKQLFPSQTQMPMICAAAKRKRNESFSLFPPKRPKKKVTNFLTEFETQYLLDKAKEHHALPLASTKDADHKPRLPKYESKRKEWQKIWIRIQKIEGADISLNKNQVVEKYIDLYEYITAKTVRKIRRAGEAGLLDFY